MSNYDATLQRANSHTPATRPPPPPALRTLRLIPRLPSISSAVNPASRSACTQCSPTRLLGGPLTSPDVSENLTGTPSVLHSPPSTASTCGCRNARSIEFTSPCASPDLPPLLRRLRLEHLRENGVDRFTILDSQRVRRGPRVPTPVRPARRAWQTAPRCSTPRSIHSPPTFTLIARRVSHRLALTCCPRPLRELPRANVRHAKGRSHGGRVRAVHEARLGVGVVARALGVESAVPGTEVLDVRVAGTREALDGGFEG